jgi:hypothetical protein
MADFSYARKIKWGNTLAFFAVVICLAYFGLSLSGFTGLLLSTESFYTTPGFQASQSGDFVWSPEQEGLLTSVKLTGYIEGNGSVKVLLRSGEKTFLVLDSSLLPGMNFTVPENETNQTAGALENVTGAAEQNQSIENQTMQNETTPLPQENITSDNNATSNETEGGITGNLIAEENVSQNLTEPLNATQQPANESQENATGNFTGPSENDAENATTPEIPENQTIQNQTFRFEDICIGTCTLPELNESSYSLTFEIENGTVLYIESIRYSILRYEAPVNLPPTGQIPDQTVSVNQTLAINLSRYFSDPDDDTLAYSVDSPINDSFIDADILAITPSQEGNFSLTVSATDGKAVVFSSFWLFVLPSNITELNATNVTEFLNVSCSGCSDCSEKLRSPPPGSYVFLDSDISGSGNCIQFSGVVNLTFDCQGHKITGQDSAGCGILFSSSRESLLKNCIVEGFYAGVYLDRQSTSNRIFSIGVSGNTYGVSLFSSTQNELQGIDGKIRVSSSSRNAISCD